MDALTLTRDVSDDLLPLKPHQCLLIVSKTWLMVNSGQVWIDNLYLKLNRRQVEPSFAFVTIGSPYRSSADVLFNSTVGQSDTYLTGITFHGEHRGNARGVQCGVTLSSFLVDGAARNEHVTLSGTRCLRYDNHDKHDNLNHCLCLLSLYSIVQGAWQSRTCYLRLQIAFLRTGQGLLPPSTSSFRA